MTDPQPNETNLYADSLPVQVLLWRPPPPPGSDLNLETPVPLELLVDSAGKVRSARSLGRVDQDLLRATTGWKFIPAFKRGHPVACKFRMDVTPTL